MCLIARLRTTRVVTGRQEDTTGGLALADEVAGSRGGEDAILADQQLLDTISGTDFGNLLNDLGVVVAAIATDDEESALSTLGDREDDASDEGLGVVGLLEDLDLLTKTGAGCRQIKGQLIT